MSILVGLLCSAAFAAGYGTAWWVHRRHVVRCARGSFYCGCEADPRCVAHNCTHHCDLYCDGRCLRLWEDAVKRGEIPLPGGDGRSEVDLSFLRGPSE